MTNKVALNWINGTWTDSKVHKESRNPATGDILGSYADGSIDDAKLSIEAAKKAFNSSWKKDRHLRYKALNELADAFESKTGELIQILSSENGKTTYEAGFEISMIPSMLRYCAALTRTTSGTSLQPAPGKYAFVLKQPIGVSGIIVPWNAPAFLLIRSLAPALAAGTTTVVKMPSQTAMTNYLVSQIIASVESIPRGVVNIFTESGAEGAKHISESPDVPVISFTGSTHIGRAIAEAGAQHLKRLNLELGGKTPMIIFNDANLDAVVPTLEKGITVFAGQFCMTGSRILVQKGISDEFTKRFAEKLKAVKVGPGTEASSDMGAMIDKSSVARVDKSVEDAIKAGAKAIVRGGPLTGGAYDNGAFYQPTLLEVTDGSLDIIQKETFGPVATIQVFEDEAEAIKLANETEFGLAASIWTNDSSRQWRVAAELDAGTIWFNEWAVVYDECEEGGFKQSGIGRLRGTQSIDIFSEQKTITLSPGELAC